METIRIKYFCSNELQLKHVSVNFAKLTELKTKTEEMLERINITGKVNGVNLTARNMRTAKIATKMSRASEAFMRNGASVYFVFV